MPKLRAMSRVATNIKNILEARGMDQKDLAESLGIDPSNFSKTLHGKHSPRLELLERIANALSVDISEIFVEPSLVEK